MHQAPYLPSCCLDSMRARMKDDAVGIDGSGIKIIPFNTIASVAGRILRVTNALRR